MLIEYERRGFVCLANNANIFANPIEDIERLFVTSLAITEVFKCTLCQRGEAMALEAIAHT